MARHLRKTIRETSPPPTVTPEGEDPAARGQLSCQTGDGDPVPPLMATGNGFNAPETRSRYDFGDVKLPPISSFLNKPPVYPGVSQTVSSKEQRVADGRGVTGNRGRRPPGEPQRPHTSPTPPAHSFTMPPTEQDFLESLVNFKNSEFQIFGSKCTKMEMYDMRHMQPGLNKNGNIKRPLNAFMVWSQIHRDAVLRTSPSVSTTHTSAQLGCDWSANAQKRPYCEVAHKLKATHNEQFPDYEYHPQRKRGRECLSPGQGAGRDPGISPFGSQDMPPAQSTGLSPKMSPYPPMMSYTVGYYHHPYFCQCHPMGLYSRIPNPRYPHDSISLEEAKNRHHYTALQRAEATTATLTREILQYHHRCQSSHLNQEVLTGPRTSSESLIEPDNVTGQQLPANNQRREDDVDVVGLP